MSADHAFDQLLDGPSAEAIAAFRKGMLPFWHPVMEAADLSAERPSGVTLLGRRLVVARLDGALVVLPDTCRHFQARLSLGTLVPVGTETGIQCAYHGWTFGKSGACVRIPQLAAGRSIPATAKLPTYQAVERYGLVWVCLAETPTFPIPDFPEMDDPSFRKVRLRESEPMQTSATRMVMGTLDDTHFPWVHEGILGDRDHPEPPDHRVWRDGPQLVVQYEIEQPPGLISTDTSRAAPAEPGPIKIRYTDYVAMPTAIRLVKESPAGRYVIWLASSPVDYNQANNFWVFARDFDVDPAKDAAFEALSVHVRLQDKPIIESQRPWIIPPFWTHIEMPIGPADMPLIEYQRWLQELDITTAI